MIGRQLFYFLLGQVGIMCLARFFFQWIIKFATLEAGAGTLFAASAVGAVLFGFRLFDGVTDPIAGTISDYWVSLGKKRKQLLLYTLLLPGLGLILTFAPSAEMSPALRWVFLASGMLIFFIGYTFYAIPYWSLIDDYSAGDDALRRQLSNILGAGILIATGVGFIVSPIIIQKFGYLNGAIIFSVLSSIGMIGPYFAEPAGLENKKPAQKSEEFSPGGAFLNALKQPRFIGLILLLGGSQMSLTIMTAAAPFVAVNLLGGSDQDVALLLGPLLCTAMPCFLFAPKLSKRFGWEKVLVAASILLAVVYSFCSSIGADIVYSPFATAMLLFACGGPMVAVLLALEGEAITDCAGAAGGQSVSIFFGVYNLVVKGLNGVAIFMAGIFASLSQQDMGSDAIRWMVFSAGICLFVGMIAYTLMSRLRARPSSSSV